MQKNLLLNVKDIQAFIGILPPWIQGSDTDLQFDLYFRFRSVSLICCPAEAGGV